MSGPPTDEAVTSAIFQAAVLTAFADGRPELTEARVVAELVAIDPRFGALADPLGLGVAARALLVARGIEDALEEILAPIVAADDRRLAFRLCARVMIADDHTAGDEAMVLGTLQERFAFSPADVRAILDEERKRRTA